MICLPVRKTSGTAREGKRPTGQLSGVALAVAATIIWAGNFVIARALRHDTSGITLNFWRWVVAAFVLAPVAARSLRADWPAIRRHLLYLISTAFFGVAVFNTLIYVAGHTTTATNLSMLAVAAPVFIVLLARVIDKELLTWRRLAGILVAIIGVSVLITHGSLTALTSLSFHRGDLLMVLATFCFAVYSILVKHRPAGIGSTSFLFATTVLGVVLLSPAYAVEAALGHAFSVTGSTLAAVAYIGVFSSAAAFLAWNKAIDLIGASRTGVIYYLTPVFTAAEAAFILSEQIGLVQIGSMMMIITGILIGNSTSAQSLPKGLWTAKPS
jgi:drug/metabolite transporter (DMT)-like permease